jgi:hypothetical protein
MDTHLLKVSGKAQLPESIEVGHNWHVSLEGSVVSETKSDNEDGSFTYTYTFKPVRLEALDPLGKVLILKDTRSRSQILRSRLFAIWKGTNDAESFDAFYDKIMANLIADAEHVVTRYT